MEQLYHVVNAKEDSGTVCETLCVLDIAICVPNFLAGCFKLCISWSCESGLKKFLQLFWLTSAWMWLAGSSIPPCPWFPSRLHGNRCFKNTRRCTCYSSWSVWWSFCLPSMGLLFMQLTLKILFNWEELQIKAVTCSESNHVQYQDSRLWVFFSQN